VIVYVWAEHEENRPEVATIYVTELSRGFYTFHFKFVHKSSDAVGHLRAKNASADRLKSVLG
jgi:hypothetical protein